jgi:OPA family glycerol-3-phosphate transporter-like MFS transporter 1/2
MPLIAIGFFIMCNIGHGIFQSTGWPANVTILSRWFPRSTRGTIMGIWNAHSSLGVIVGKLIATACLHHYGWHSAFLIPALVCLVIGITQFIWLTPDPRSVLPLKQLK